MLRIFEIALLIVMVLLPYLPNDQHTFNISLNVEHNINSDS